MSKKTESTDKKVIQSFTPHRHRFVLKDNSEVLLPELADSTGKYDQKGASFEVVKNLCIVSAEALAELKENAIFNILLEETDSRKPLIRVLDKVPDGYVSADAKVADANLAAEKAQAEVADLTKANAEKDVEIEALKKKLAELGGAK